MAFFKTCIAAFFAVTLTTPVLADALIPEWEERRVALNALGPKACTSRAAMDSLKNMADKRDNPVAAFWVYYAQSNRKCATYTGGGRAYLEQSANAGFPLAEQNLGVFLLRGSFGYPRDPKAGKVWMERAISKGYGVAAASLAQHYTQGLGLPKDQDAAVKYYKIAADEGVKDTMLAQVRRVMPTATVAAAKRAVSAGQTTAPAASAPTATENAPARFAALAVQNSDGAFGFAFDQTSEAAARDRALAECRNRGGTGCQAKLVIKGPACIAYHSNPGSSAFGWGHASDDAQATRRAASECRTRNGDQTCRSTAWSCNTRSKDPIDLMFEARNEGPQVPQTASAIRNPGTCTVSMVLTCAPLANGDIYTIIHARRLPAHEPVCHFMQRDKNFRNVSIHVSYKTGRKTAQNREWRDLPEPVQFRIDNIWDIFAPRAERTRSNCTPKNGTLIFGNSTLRGTDRMQSIYDGATPTWRADWGKKNQVFQYIAVDIGDE